MEMAEFIYLMVGVVLGVLLAGVLYLQEKDNDRQRREDETLKSVDHGTRAIRQAPASSTFTDDGRYAWVVHNEYHLSLWLIDEWLQYWPTKSKWRWHARTYTGNVEAFIEEQLELYESRRSDDG